MEMIATTSLNIAKHVFQVRGVDAAGNDAIKRRLRRGEVLTFFAKLQPTLSGIEACTTSHYWARELSAMGHNVKLMPPHYVKPYVNRQKNGMTDAAAICEAVTRPSMRFVLLKSEEQQAVLMLHRSRELLVRQHTMLVNALRAHLAEFGIVMKQGKAGAAAVSSLVQEAANSAPSPAVGEALLPLVEQLHQTEERVTLLKGDLMGLARARHLSRATMRNIRQNLFFAFIYNAADVPIAAGGALSAFRNTTIAHHSSRGDGIELGQRCRQCAAAEDDQDMRKYHRVSGAGHSRLGLLEPVQRTLTFVPILTNL